MPRTLLHGRQPRVFLPVALVVLAAAEPALAQTADFGTCMSASLIPGGPFGSGPFGGYECGDEVPAYAWTVTTEELLASGATDAATGTVRSRASTWAADGGSPSASFVVKSWDTLIFATDGQVAMSWRFEGEIANRALPPGHGQGNLVAMKINLGPTFGWTYYSHDDPDPYHAGRYDIQGAVTLHVTAGEPFVVYQFLQTSANGPGVDVDFSHTGRIAFELPPQQSFTSASGVFLTGAVPEPAKALTLGLGMALIGGWRCRQRPAPAS
jgi:hypothetical protein